MASNPVLGSLGIFSVEMIQQIALEVHNLSRQSMFALLRVNKSFYSIIRPLAFREVRFDMTETLQGSPATPETRDLKQLETLLYEIDSSHSTFFNCVRRVTVISQGSVYPGYSRAERDWRVQSSITERFSYWNEYMQQRWSTFVSIIDRVCNLHDITFDCLEPVPITLLEVLHKRHPSSRLHVRNWSPSLHLPLRAEIDFDSKDLYDLALAKSSCLYSVETVGRWQNGYVLSTFYDVCFERMVSLAPNLQQVKYKLSGHDDTDVRLGVSPGPAMVEKYEVPTLIVLEGLAQNKPVRKKWTSLSWNALTFDRFRRLCRFVDFSHLERLELGSFWNKDILEYATERQIFAGLKELSLRVPDTRVVQPYNPSEDVITKSTISDFVCSCGPLESLSIVDYYDYLDVFSVILTHRETLQSLSLHEVEHSSKPRPMLSVEDIEAIIHMVPHLKNLELDINRGEREVEAEILEVIESAPSLETLTIYYDLGLRHAFWDIGLMDADAKKDRERLNRRYRSVDERFGRQIWDALHSGSLRSSLDGIGRLTLYIGEPSRENGFWERFWRHEYTTKQKIEVRRDYETGCCWKCDVVVTVEGPRNV